MPPPAPKKRAAARFARHVVAVDKGGLGQGVRVWVWVATGIFLPQAHHAAQEALAENVGALAQSGTATPPTQRRHAKPAPLPLPHPPSDPHTAGEQGERHTRARPSSPVAPQAALLPSSSLLSHHAPKMAQHPTAPGAPVAALDGVLRELQSFRGQLAQEQAVVEAERLRLQALVEVRKRRQSGVEGG